MTLVNKYTLDNKPFLAVKLLAHVLMPTELYDIIITNILCYHSTSIFNGVFTY